MHNEFLDAMKASGLNCNEPITADGEVHRFASGGRGNKNSWYILFEHGGSYGDWKLGINEKWTASNQNLTPEQRQAIKDKLRKAKAAHDKDIKKRQEQAAQKASNDWNKLLETGSSPYLERKQVKAYGIRYGKTAIAVPMRDIEGKLWNLQIIYHDGKKLFQKGGKKKDCFHSIGDLATASSINVCEGYSTGASIYEATGITTAIAFDAGNLEPVIAAIKSKYPDITITIAADDDVWKEVNTGRIKAEEAAAKHGCNVIFPIFLESIKKEENKEFFDPIKKGGSNARN